MSLVDVMAAVLLHGSSCARKAKEHCIGWMLKTGTNMKFIHAFVLLLSLPSPASLAKLYQMQTPGYIHYNDYLDP